MDGLTQQYKKLIALNISEFKILLLALFIVPVTKLLLKIIGFQKTQLFFKYFSKNNSPSSHSKEIQYEIANSITRMVTIAASHGPIRAQCLNISIVSQWLLIRRGIICELKIGANKDHRISFNAHAWLEYNDQVINESSHVRDRFSVFNSERL